MQGLDQRLRPVTPSPALHDATSPGLRMLEGHVGMDGKGHLGEEAGKVSEGVGELGSEPLFQAQVWLDSAFLFLGLSFLSNQ